MDKTIAVLEKNLNTQYVQDNPEVKQSYESKLNRIKAYKQALETALEFLHKDKPDMILINGDLLDFHSLSRFVKDPRSRSLSGELQMGRDFFAMLQKQFPKTKVVYKIGNHEERLETYLYVKAPELLDMQEFKMDKKFLR